MKSIGINEARTHFSRLMRRVAAGEEIVIARGTTPVARLVAVKPAEQRKLGIDAGKFTVPDNFNHPITEDSLGLFGLSSTCSTPKCGCGCRPSQSGSAATH
ncbi:MAG: type II toxin-antitoxin system Phd/YefM family antitoxin [Acidimicrobiia bacterium]